MIGCNERRPHEALNNLRAEEWHKNLLKNEKSPINTVREKGYLQSNSTSFINLPFFVGSPALFAI
jgi:hypothetical protein